MVDISERIAVQRRPATIVVYRGPSMLDGAPIVCIASGLDGSSSNGKTGPMIQVWIMREDIAPHHAQKTGDDSSVCGDCKKKPSVAKGSGMLPCYVKTFQGPRSTWEGSRKLPTMPLESVREAIQASGYAVRLGAYGDPSALPADVLTALTVDAPAHTGYTHQWRDRRFQWLRYLVMASVDTVEERDQAHALGWRTFRAISRREAFADLVGGPGRQYTREIWCPAVSHDREVTCATCRLCDGVRIDRDGRRANIAIIEH